MAPFDLELVTNSDIRVKFILWEDTSLPLTVSPKSTLAEVKQMIWSVTKYKGDPMEFAFAIPDTQLYFVDSMPFSVILNHLPIFEGEKVSSGSSVSSGAHVAVDIPTIECALVHVSLMYDKQMRLGKAPVPSLSMRAAEVYRREVRGSGIIAMSFWESRYIVWQHNTMFVYRSKRYFESGARPMDIIMMEGMHAFAVVNNQNQAAEDCAAVSSGSGLSSPTAPATGAGKNILVIRSGSQTMGGGSIAASASAVSSSTKSYVYITPTNFHPANTPKGNMTLATVPTSQISPQDVSKPRDGTFVFSFADSETQEEWARVINIGSLRFLKQVFLQITREIERRDALRLEGIFRVPGNKEQINDIVAEYYSGKQPNLELVNDEHALAGALKTFIREAPEPIFTYELYDYFSSLYPGGIPVQGVVDKLRIGLERLPPVLRSFAAALFDFLARVAARDGENKMNNSNLSIVITPNILRPRVESTDASMSNGKALRCAVTDIITHKNTLIQFPKSIKELEVNDFTSNLLISPTIASARNSSFYPPIPPLDLANYPSPVPDSERSVLSGPNAILTLNSFSRRNPYIISDEPSAGPAYSYAGQRASIAISSSHPSHPANNSSLSSLNGSGAGTLALATNTPKLGTSTSPTAGTINSPGGSNNDTFSPSGRPVGRTNKRCSVLALPTDFKLDAAQAAAAATASASNPAPSASNTVQDASPSLSSSIPIRSESDRHAGEEPEDDDEDDENSKHLKNLRKATWLPPTSQSKPQVTTNSNMIARVNATQNVAIGGGMRSGVTRTGAAIQGRTPGQSAGVGGVPNSTNHGKRGHQFNPASPPTNSFMPNSTTSSEPSALLSMNGVRSAYVKHMQELMGAHSELEKATKRSATMTTAAGPKATSDLDATLFETYTMLNELVGSLVQNVRDTTHQLNEWSDNHA